MRWCYRSPFGVLEIVPKRNGNFVLVLDGEEFDESHSPQAVADNLYTHTSGFFEWDVSDFDGPTDLSEWTYIPK